MSKKGPVFQVLLVYSDTKKRVELHEFLTRAGLSVQSVGDVQRLITTLEDIEVTYRVVVADHFTGKYNGRELLQYAGEKLLREEIAIPPVIITGVFTQARIKALRDFGYADVVDDAQYHWQEKLLASIRLILEAVE